MDNIFSLLKRVNRIINVMVFLKIILKNFLKYITLTKKYFFIISIIIYQYCEIIYNKKNLYKIIYNILLKKIYNLKILQINNFYY